MAEHRPSIGTEPAPVFVVGAERSGSTLFRLMLAGHPDIAVAGQFEYAVELIGDDGTRPALDELREHLALDRVFGMSGLSIDASLGHDELLDDLLRQSLDRAGASVAVGVVHTHFDRLLHVWPGARFVHLVRDGRDAARSAMAMGWACDGWHGAQRWLDAETLWDRLNDRLGPDHRLELRYEELVGDAVDVLRRTCEFIGVPYQPAMLDYARTTDYDLPDAGLAEQWRTLLDPDDLALVECRVGDLLDRRGYRRSLADPQPPSSPRLTLLAARNRVFRWRRSIGTYGPALWAAHALTKRVGPRPWFHRVRLRMNDLERAGLRRSWETPEGSGG